MTLTIKMISDALGISRSRVEQWISRGYFRTPDKPVLGKAREWDERDALRLALMNTLMENRISAETAGRMAFNDPLYAGENSFFVAWRGWSVGACGGKFYYPEIFYHDVVRGQDLGGFLQNPDVEFSVVVNLDILSASVKEQLEALENFKTAVENAGAKYDG